MTLFFLLFTANFVCNYYTVPECTYLILIFYISNLKFVSDLRQVGHFLWLLRFPPPNKTGHHDITEILLKEALYIINLNLSLHFQSTLQETKEKKVWKMLVGMSLSVRQQPSPYFRFRVIDFVFMYGDLMYCQRWLLLFLRSEVMHRDVTIFPITFCYFNILYIFGWPWLYVG
jgi:hypothetical protein